jgi:hypothetical protein
MLQVFGASDDLMEFRGDVYEEFNWYLDSEEHRYLSFSDGTVLKAWYDEDGIWKLQLMFKGNLFINIEQFPVSEDKNDIANFSDGIKWVVGGQDLAK